MAQVALWPPQRTLNHGVPYGDAPVIGYIIQDPLLMVKAIQYLSGERLRPLRLNGIL